MSIVRAVTLGVLLLTLAVAAWPATGTVAPSSFLFLDELEVGMEGIGKTTVRDNRMQEFQVRIIGIVDNPGEVNDYIMVRSHGDAIEAAGGYAQGMSGSPIYVDDRLVGAFYGAYAFNESPDPIGFVRPIETMLPLAEAVAHQAAQESMQQGMFNPQAPAHPELTRALTQATGNDIREIRFTSTPPSLAERQAHPDMAHVVPMSPSIWVGGLSGRALEWLKSGVTPEVVAPHAPGLLSLGPIATGRLREALTAGVEDRFGKRVLPMATAQGTDTHVDFAEFEPGRPMSALLAQGDVSFGSVCTTSYIDPAANVLLACGHQIYMTGESSMFLGRARVIDTVNSAEISFVLPQVSRDEIVGTIRQDRTQAIGASIGDQPRSVDLHAQIVDRATGNRREFNVRMADSGNLLGSLVFSSLLQTVDSTINRIGQGTMTLRYTIEGENLPKALERTDVFASQSDVAVPGPLQVAQAVLLLDQNEFTDPKISRVDVQIEVEKPLQQFRVVEIATDRESYQPGDTVHYTATLRAFRGEERTVEGKIELPDDISPRQVTLRISGGAQQQQQASSSSEAPEFTDLEGLIRAVEASETNDQITVELLGLPRPDPDGDDARQTASTSFGDVQRLGSGVVTGEERTSLKIDRASPDRDDGSGGSPRDDEDNPDSDDDDSSNDDSSEDDGPGCSSNYYC